MSETKVVNGGELRGKFLGYTDEKFLQSGAFVISVKMEVTESWDNPQSGPGSYTCYPTIGFYGKVAEKVAELKLTINEPIYVRFKLRTSPKKDNPNEYWTNTAGVACARRQANADDIGFGEKTPAKIDDGLPV